MRCALVSTSPYQKRVNFKCSLIFYIKSLKIHSFSVIRVYLASSWFILYMSAIFKEAKHIEVRFTVVRKG